MVSSQHPPAPGAATTAADTLSIRLAPYLAVASRSFRRFATYRGATVAGVFTNTVFGLIYAAVFDAVHDEAGRVDGFTPADTAFYVFAAQAFLMMTGTLGDREISDRIRTGDIAADLYRPVDFHLWWLAHDYGKAAYHALARGVPPLIIGTIVLDLVWPGALEQWLWFIVATVGGVTVAFNVRFLANITGFWLLDAKGVVALVAIVQGFLGGHIIPLYFLPGPVEALARLSPFAAITAHPIELVLGAHRGWGAVLIIAHQVIWIAILSALARLALGRARRKLVIQGG